MYSISLENFSGPLEKLLELIEQKKMNITSISLAAVTADFVAYAKKMSSEAQPPKTEVEPRNTDYREFARLVSDFLVVATQLLFIKSRAILPQLELPQDEEENMFDLEKQLRVYSALKPIFAELKKFWMESDQSFSREYLKTTVPVFYPPGGLAQEDIRQSFERATAVITTLVKEEQKMERQLVTLEEKIKELSESVLQGSQRFSSLAGEQTKHEVIVLFLALLHLLRDRKVQATQDGQFGDILVY
ncbi:hypothetical protein A2755_00580 [Candidatus Wolfebacteria bacterium RIFCSPHIGHO2_01_FULL_48_22]|uniref:Segregation and condensation protein A n=2 Tax=Candidatus Wolfeibacteriota TaxID=1752735 RepID=A0A1F8DV36_9BACT|nr:MAG: hypothetical protein A2755_00580 [Candidatus Wolfebacteria bacterium RIFCSPHIGHO2_01_FULL_48_22]OGM92659.1 MAG: hypothetical protein A2935_04045 [Candidatus Wolfebacteria bacterium RIFCSPLOWO2_01_FULL_47_17b]